MRGTKILKRTYGSLRKKSKWMGTGKKKRVLEENSRKGENGTKETKSRLLKVEDRERELEQEYMKLKGQSWEGRVGWRDRKHVEAGPGAAGGCGQ